MDIGSLQDDELRQQLLEYGVNVGPIVSTTRLFYEKKLGKLLESGGVQQPSEPEESEEDEEEEEQEDEEVQINYRQPEPKPKPSKPVAEKVPVIKPQFTSTPISQSDYTPIIKARTATPTQAIRRNTGRTEGRKETSTTPTQEEKQGGGGGGFSMMLKLLFVAILVFLVYLVIINMNPSADQLPLSFEGEV